MTVQKERLVTLSDGTCMNDILYVIHTDAPVLVLRMEQKMRSLFGKM